MEYFVLTISEDGDVYLDQETKEQILEAIESGELDPEKIAGEVPNGNVMEVGDGAYIFKGELVKPQAIKVVDKYDIE